MFIRKLQMQIKKMKNINFEKIKEKILKKAKKEYACKEEFKRAFVSKNIDELEQVVLDNLRFCIICKIINLKNVKYFSKLKFDKNIIRYNNYEFILNGNKLDWKIYCNQYLVKHYKLKNGKLHGTTINYFDKRIMKDIQYSNALANNGETIIDYNNEGMIESKCNYKNGKLHGIYEVRNIFGEIIKQDYYVNGKIKNKNRK